MPILNETGRIVIRMGLDEDGDEAFDFGIQDIDNFQAAYILRLAADLVHQAVMESVDMNMGLREDDEPES
jgi:hypothetical protein